MERLRLRGEAGRLNNLGGRAWTCGSRGRRDQWLLCGRTDDDSRRKETIALRASSLTEMGHSRGNLDQALSLCLKPKGKKQILLF